MLGSKPGVLSRHPSTALLPSTQGLAVFMVPYCLRALQLVVAYNSRYRLKYARYVKANNILKISVVAGAAIAVAALLVWYHMPERYSRYTCLFGPCAVKIELGRVLPLSVPVCRPRKSHTTINLQRKSHARPCVRHSKLKL